MTMFLVNILTASPSCIVCTLFSWVLHSFCQKYQLAVGNRTPMSLSAVQDHLRVGKMCQERISRSVKENGNLFFKAFCSQNLIIIDNFCIVLFSGVHTHCTYTLAFDSMCSQSSECISSFQHCQLFSLNIARKRLFQKDWVCVSTTVSSPSPETNSTGLKWDKDDVNLLADSVIATLVEWWHYTLQVGKSPQYLSFKFCKFFRIPRLQQTKCTCRD